MKDLGGSQRTAVFSRIMDQILKGVNGVVCYLDDALVTGESVREFRGIKKKPRRGSKEIAKKYGFKVHKNKCPFFKIIFLTCDIVQMQKGHNH